MNLTKKVLCALLIFSLAFSFTSCSVSGIINKLTDGKVAIDNAKWDKSKTYGLEAPKGKLESSFADEDTIMYSVSGIKEEDATSYIEGLKSAGYTYKAVTLEDFNYTGTNKEGQTINFAFSKETSMATIVFTKDDIPSDEDNNGETFAGTTREWNSKEIGGLPDPGVKITSYMISKEYSSYSFEELDNPNDYVEKIKAAGYNVDVEFFDLEDSIMFVGYNEAGDGITFVSSETGSAINFTNHQ